MHPSSSSLRMLPPGPGRLPRRNWLPAPGAGGLQQRRRIAAAADGDDDELTSRTSAAATSAPAAPLRPRFSPLGLGSAASAAEGREAGAGGERRRREPARRAGRGGANARPLAAQWRLCSAAPAREAAARAADLGEAGPQPGGAGARAPGLRLPSCPCRARPRLRLEPSRRGRAGVQEARDCGDPRVGSDGGVEVDLGGHGVALQGASFSWRK